MSKLSSKQKDRLSANDFGLPEKRAYPMPDRTHAANAKARAEQMVENGKLSKSDEAKIDHKADAILKK